MGFGILCGRGLCRRSLKLDAGRQTSRSKEEFNAKLFPPPLQLCSLPETFQDAERKATNIFASVLGQKNRRIQNGRWRTFRGFSAVVRSAERASSERKSRRPEGVNTLNCFRPKGLDISKNKTKPPLPPQPLTNKLQAGEKKQLETRYFQMGCMTLVGAMNPN
jgi:hypothetical protein